MITLALLGIGWCVISFASAFLYGGVTRVRNSQVPR